MSVCCSIISGILKLVAVIFASLLAVFLALQLLEINMDFTMGSLTCKYNLFLLLKLISETGTVSFVRKHDTPLSCHVL